MIDSPRSPQGSSIRCLMAPSFLGRRSGGGQGHFPSTKYVEATPSRLLPVPRPFVETRSSDSPGAMPGNSIPTTLAWDSQPRGNTTPNCGSGGVSMDWRYFVRRMPYLSAIRTTDSLVVWDSE
jgi:hypothetical protein